MIIQNTAEKSLDKIKYHFNIKTLHELGMEKN
jgi:hypothetical protein